MLISLTRGPTIVKEGWLPEQEGGLDGEAGEEDADESQPKRLIMEVKVGGNDIANIVQSSFFKLQSQMMK